MRRTTFLIVLVLLGWPVGLGGATRAASAVRPDDAAPTPEILIPGVSDAEPILSVAASPAHGSRLARQAVFLCLDGNHGRSCGVSLFGDGSSDVSEGPPLFPGMFCSIEASMAWSADGRLGIATVCRRDGGAGVLLQVTDQNGDPLGPPSLVATVDPVGPVTDPLVVPSDDGTFWVFWLGGYPDRCRLRGRRFGRDGAPAGEMTDLTLPKAGGSWTRLAGCALSGGDVVVAWEDDGDESGDRRIALLRLDRGGEVVARHRLSGGDPSASDRMPVVKATAGGSVLAWLRTWPRSNVPTTVLVQRLSEDLSPAGPRLDLHDLRPEAFAFRFPAIAPKGRDLLVAWRESPHRGALDDLMVGRLASDGSWIGEPRRVVRWLQNNAPRLWLEPSSGDRWSLLWRQPPDEAELPHPWLRRLIVPWQDGFWNTGPGRAVPDPTPGGGHGP